jgi:hypothetical protein
MTKESWPVLMAPTNAAIASKLQEMDRIREDDISNFENLPQLLVSGRKVQRIPANSGDVLPADRVGDLNYDDDYLYLAVLSGSSLVWRRIGLSAW